MKLMINLFQLALNFGRNYVLNMLLALKVFLNHTPKRMLAIEKTYFSIKLMTIITFQELFYLISNLES